MKKIKKSKAITILLVSVLLAGLITGYGYFYYVNSKNDNSTEITANEEKIDLSPPTKEDAQEVERHKQELTKETETITEQPAPEQQQDVKPVFGFLRQAEDLNIESNGYITTTIEDDGLCTLMLERNGISVSVSKKAMPDAQSTICGLMVIDRSKLQAGTWNATISYKSGKHQGVSETRTVEVK